MWRDPLHSFATDIRVRGNRFVGVDSESAHFEVTVLEMLVSAEDGGQQAEAVPLGIRISPIFPIKKQLTIVSARKVQKKVDEWRKLALTSAQIQAQEELRKGCVCVPE